MRLKDGIMTEGGDPVSVYADEGGATVELRIGGIGRGSRRVKMKPREARILGFAILRLAEAASK